MQCPKGKGGRKGQEVTLMYLNMSCKNKNLAKFKMHLIMRKRNVSQHKHIHSGSQRPPRVRRYLLIWEWGRAVQAGNIQPCQAKPMDVKGFPIAKGLRYCLRLGPETIPRILGAKWDNLAAGLAGDSREVTALLVRRLLRSLNKGIGSPKQSFPFFSWPLQIPDQYLPLCKCHKWF